MPIVPRYPISTTKPPEKPVDIFPILRMPSKVANERIRELLEIVGLADVLFPDEPTLWA